MQISRVLNPDTARPNQAKKPSFSTGKFLALLGVLLAIGSFCIAVYLSKETFPSEAEIAMEEAVYKESLDFEAVFEKLKSGTDWPKQAAAERISAIQGIQAKYPSAPQADYYVARELMEKLPPEPSAAEKLLDKVIASQAIEPNWLQRKAVISKGCCLEMNGQEAAARVVFRKYEATAKDEDQRMLHRWRILDARCGTLVTRFAHNDLRKLKDEVAKLDDEYNGNMDVAAVMAFKLLNSEASQEVLECAAELAKNVEDRRPYKKNLMNLLKEKLQAKETP